jgi:ribosome-binding protein aMBF1 (putative translation factor)
MYSDRKNRWKNFSCRKWKGRKMMTIPAIDMVATGRNIMKLRKAAGLSVREIQNIFGFTTPQAIYKWQHGTAMPTIDNLVVLAAVLDVTIDEILVVQREDIVQFAT